MSNHSFFKEIITGGRSEHNALFGTQVGPNEGLRKGILTVSKTPHNSRSSNENRIFIGQKDGIEEGPDDGGNELGAIDGTSDGTEAGSSEGIRKGILMV